MGHYFGEQVATTDQGPTIDEKLSELIGEVHLKRLQRGYCSACLVCDEVREAAELAQLRAFSLRSYAPNAVRFERF